MANPVEEREEYHEVHFSDEEPVVEASSDEVESQCITRRVSQGAFWVFMSTLSLTFFILNKAYFETSGLLGRVTRTATSFGSGASLGGLLSTLPSREVKQRIRLEAWRMGAPAYFLLTQLYLNSEDEVEQEWLIDTMLSLWGFQLASLVDAYVTLQFQERLVETELAGEVTPLVNENRRFTLITDYNPTIRAVKLVFMGALGSGMVAGSFWVADPIDSHILCDFGSFLLSESITIPLWEYIVERWGDRLETQFAVDDNASDFPLEPSGRLKFYRGLNRTLQITLPLAIIGLFYKPRTATLAVAGGLHGIHDEIKRFGFTHNPVAKILAVRNRVFQGGRARQIIEISWRVTRVATEAFGLGYFGYLVFMNHNGVEDLAIGTFIGTTALGYASTLFVDRVFSPQSSSSLMQTLFFRTLRSPEWVGIEPLYFYYYTVNYPIDIGSGSLNSITFQQGTIAFISWGAYGWRLGQDLASFESRRLEEVPRTSLWLIYSNTLALIQRLEGVIS